MTRTTINRFLWRLLAGTAGVLLLATCQSDAPDYPESLTAEPGDHKVILRWSVVKSADQYHLYWATESGVEPSDGTKLADVTSPYTHTGRTNGTTYYYVATAENGDGESSQSAEASATPLPPKPDAPDGVEIVTGNGKNKVSWEPVSRAQSYSLYWSTTSMLNKSTGTRIKPVTSPYTHTGRINGTLYYYVVTATNLGGESGESSKVSGRPLGFDKLLDTLDAGGGAEAEAHFGERAALQDDLAFVGAPLADVFPLGDAGKVHLFQRDSGADTWSETQLLTASDGAALDHFGSSVAVSDDIALIGAKDAQPGGNPTAGAVYTFDRDTLTDTWGEAQKLSASDEAAGDSFGHAVAIDGDTALVGAPNADLPGDTDAGAVYVFERDPDTGIWSEAQKLVPSLTGSGQFGWAVALEGDRAVIGAPMISPDLGGGPLAGAGVVYVFDRDPDTATWSETVVITRSSSEAAAGDAFGRTVATSGLYLAAGAPQADVDPGTGPLANAGKVYLYVLDEDSGSWSLATQNPPVSDDPEAGDLFGGALALEGNTLLVGAPNADATAGKAFAFYRNSATGVWNTTPVTIAPGGLATGDGFGFWTALSEGLGMIGAPTADPDLGGGPITNAGLIYAYK